MLRLHRPQRRGQDHDHQDPGDAAAADLGRGPGLRLRGRLPEPQDPPADRLRARLLRAPTRTWSSRSTWSSSPRPTASPASSARKIVGDVLELTDLTYKRDALVDSLSRGMKQRLSIARVLLHDPKVLLLDEPASGLDPRARIEIRELLKELHRMGKTIIISSHILPELAELCNTVGIIEQGKMHLLRAGRRHPAPGAAGHAAVRRRGGPERQGRPGAARPAAGRRTSRPRTAA